jgi:polyhydroxybutyrate depolymerase
MRAPLALALCLLACGARARTDRPLDSPALTRASLVVAGTTRTFAYYAPPGATRPLPLVVALHGRGGDGDGQDRLSHLAEVARDAGFIVAFPDGHRRSWHDAREVGPAAEAHVDDVGFVRAIIDWMVASAGADAGRVFVTGMSNGGFMTGTLACALADRVAAVGMVAATMPEALESACAPGRPVSVAIIAGDEDPLVPYGGGRTRGADGAVLSAEASARLWARLDGCAAAPRTLVLPDQDPNDGTHTEVTVFGGCAGGAETRLYTVHGGGHTWPGGWAYLGKATVGRTARDFDASRELWAFFAAHGGARAGACLGGRAPPGTLVELRPLGAATPLTVGPSGRYEVCGLAAGAYRVAFARDDHELVLDATVAAGERRTLDVCTGPPTLPPASTLSGVGDPEVAQNGYQKEVPKPQLVACPR